MTDQWVPGPPPVPTPPIPGLPPANSWNPVPGCSVGPGQPSIVDGVVITGVPAQILAPYAWGITLNDGSGPPNFTIDHYDATNTLIDSPIEIAGSNGQITFNQAIFVNGMQASGNLFIQGAMQFPSLANLFILGGAAGQVLTTVSAGGFLGWTSPVIAADAPLDGNLYGRVNGGWSSGGVINGVLYVQGANSFALVAPGGFPVSIMGGRGQAPSASWRWQMQLGNGEAETGGNAGSNFSLTSLSDAGSILNTPFSINRASGVVTIAGTSGIGALPPFLALNSSQTTYNIVQGQTNGSARWQILPGDYSAELGGNLGSNFTIRNYDDSGVQLGIPFQINRASGNATFGYGVTVTGNLAATNIQATGRLILADPSSFQMGGGAADYVLSTNGLGVLSWAPQAGGPGGSVPEAPVDGTTYGRNDAAWVNVLATSGGILTGNLTISAGGLSITGGLLSCINLNATGAATIQSLLVNGNAAFLGNVTLANAPVGGSDAANKGYVDGLAGTTTPLMNGAAAVGVGTTWARTDHVHPTDTTRYAASNPSGYQTAAQVAAVLPPASTTLPLPSGVAAVGVGTTYARADHVHPVVYMNDNRIINGDMRIDQRNNGAATTPAAGANYVVDRWQYVAAQAGKFSFQQRAFGPLGSNGYCLVASVPAAYASVASDYFCVQQKIEGFNVFDLNWGASPASPVTLSFWAHSDKAGTHSGAISNGAANRSYPFTFTLAANTWAKIAVTIPGDTTGTWAIDNSASLTVIFNLGSGSTLLGPAGAWAGVQYLGATGSVNIVSTASSHLYLTDVKLEIGSVATPYNRQSLAKSMADCQRYFYNGVPAIKGQSVNTSVVSHMGARHSVKMRAAPTLTMTALLPIFDGLVSTTIASINSNYSTADILEIDGTTTAAISGAGYPVGVIQGGGGNLNVSAEL